MNKRWLTTGGILLAALIVFGVVFLSLQPEPLAAVELKRQDVVATLTVTGEVRADLTVAFSPPVSAQIASISVDEGDAIHPGQLLVQLDTGQVVAQVNEARARAAQAQAQYQDVRQGTRPEEIRLWEARYRESVQRIQQVQTMLASARTQAQDAARDAERLRSLYREGMASEQEYLNRQTQANTARQEVRRLEAEISAARAQRAQTSAQLAQARNGPTAPELREAAAGASAARAGVTQTQARLRDYKIFSNISGIVTQRLQDPGDLATPGQPVLRVVKPETLEIVASLEESDIPKVRVGDKAYVILDALPGTALDGHVRRLGSQVNPQNGTVDTRVVLEPSAWSHLKGVSLMPGMTADVNIVTERLRDALVLPATAVRNQGGRWMVYVFRGNQLQRQFVQAERISVENFRIISGLEPGDWVAAVAGENLLNKRRVRPAPEDSMPKPSRPPGGMSAP